MTAMTDELAALVGFDVEHRAWMAEPEELEKLIPGISLVLYRLFNETEARRAHVINARNSLLNAVSTLVEEHVYACDEIAGADESTFGTEQFAATIKRFQETRSAINEIQDILEF